MGHPKFTANAALHPAIDSFLIISPFFFGEKAIPDLKGAGLPDPYLLCSVGGDMTHLQEAILGRATLSQISGD